jgi:HEAT repeat protein
MDGRCDYLRQFARIGGKFSFKVFLFLLLIGLACLSQSTEAQPDQGQFEGLLQILRTGNAYQRQNSIREFARLDDLRVVPVLVELLKDGDAGIRTYAAQHLALLADKRSANALAHALGDKSGNVRKYAAEGLLKVGEERHIPALVASVMGHLPDQNTSERECWPAAPAIEAIGRLSSKAPAEIVGLINRIADDKTVKDEDWWILLGDAAKALGEIGDKAAYDPLQRARTYLEEGHQDYRTWHAVRMAMAAIQPQTAFFDSPVADILASVRLFKTTETEKREKWILPLAGLDEKAVADLGWATRFRSNHDRDRRSMAVEALGEKGGYSSARALREFIQRQASLPEQDRRKESYTTRKGLLALLKADPNESTAKEVVQDMRLLDPFEQERLLREISRSLEQRIPAEIKLVLYEGVLLDPNRPRSDSHPGLSTAVSLLGQMGGQRAAEVISQVLLDPPGRDTARFAAWALGTIKGFDAIPTLIKASSLRGAPTREIAEAMATTGDPRAIPYLKEMAKRE